MNPRELRIFCGIFSIAAVLAPATGATGTTRTDAVAPPAVIERIRVAGNEKIKTFVIRRAIPFSPGDRLDPAGLAQARARVARIPGVDYSEIRVVENTPDSTVTLYAFVTEKSALEGYPVVRRGYEDRMSFGLAAAQRNFRGRGETLRGSVLFRGNSVFSAAWENPWLGDNQWRLGAGLSVFYKAYDYVYDDLGGIYRGADVTRYGLETKVFRAFEGGLRPWAGLGFEIVESGATTFTIESGGDRYLTASLGLEYDGRDSRRFPWSGVFLEAAGREVGPGAKDYSIHETGAAASVFAPLTGRTVLALGGRLTYRNADRIPPYRREHLGGSATLRGREFGSFHGASSVISSAELRFPLNFSRNRPVEDLLLGVCAYLFADAGAAWERGQGLDGDSFHGTFGFGMLVLNGSVPGLRLDYGWHRRSSGRLEIDVGAKF